MIKRLRIKFICINMAIVTAMQLVIFGMVLHFTGENLESQSIRMMQSVMENRFQPGRPGQQREEIQLPYFRVTEDFLGEQIVVSNGYYDLSDEEMLQEIIREAKGSRQQTGVLKNYNLRFSKHHGLFGEQMVFVDISGEIATMSSLVKTCLFIGILSLSVFLVLSILLARWAIKPVETAWNQQRQFVADASHELKTPLTVIMTNAELLQDPHYDEADRMRFSGSILTMSRQMRGLVESMLELARVDNGAVKMNFTDLDFSELISDCLLPFEPLYFEQELPLVSDIEENLRVRGSQAHLKQVADILLDNAAKYSSGEDAVRVSLKRQGNSGLLSVAGPGAPISREDLTNIFKRFYRIDKARTRDGSYGLGLSIADSIVREHGGRIWAESEGGINTFFVQISLI